MTFGAYLHISHVWDMEKINNHMDTVNMQCACSPSLQLNARMWQIPPFLSCCLSIYSWCTCVELMLEIWKNKKLHQFIKYAWCMLTFFAAQHQKLANSPFLKLFVSAFIDYTVTVSADFCWFCWRYEKNQQPHQSIEYTVCMLTFLVTHFQKGANFPSLYQSISVVIEDTVTVLICV